jgi:hypothetical protein
MPWCPNCRYEYREGFTTCSDCGAALVEQLPEAGTEPREEAGAANDESLVAVYEAEDELQSETIKGVLEQAGIPVVEKHFRVDGILMATLGSVHYPFSRLFTLESRAEEARQVIRDYLAAYQRGDLALPEESEASPAEEKSKRRKKF